MPDAVPCAVAVVSTVLEHYGHANFVLFPPSCYRTLSDVNSSPLCLDPTPNYRGKSSSIMFSLSPSSLLAPLHLFPFPFTSPSPPPPVSSYLNHFFLSPAHTLPHKPRSKSKLLNR